MIIISLAVHQARIKVTQFIVYYVCLLKICYITWSKAASPAFVLFTSRSVANGIRIGKIYGARQMMCFPVKHAEWNRQTMQSGVIGEATQKCTKKEKCKVKLTSCSDVGNYLN